MNISSKLIFSTLIFSSLHELHDDLSFLPERMKVKTFEKLLAKLNVKTECYFT